MAVLLWGTVWPMEAGGPPAGDAAPFRIAFSSRMFADINENDARAAVKAWSLAVATERNLPVDPSATIGPVGILSNLLAAGQVDAIGLPVDEFLTLNKTLAFQPLFVGVQGDSTMDEYLLLVRNESITRTVVDLRAKSLLIFEHPRTCLAIPWLDALLARDGFQRTEQFFNPVMRKTKLSAAALPVFFGTADACLVTRYGFDTLVELNPQVGKRLRILAHSPKLVPTVLAVRARYESPIRGQVLAAMRDLHQTAGGQQVLTVFQISRLEEHPPACLENAAALVDEYARLQPAPAPPARPASAILTPQEADRPSLQIH